MKIQSFTIVENKKWELFSRIVKAETVLHNCSLVDRGKWLGTGKTEYYTVNTDNNSYGYY